jgi:hypothetical protein
MLWGVVLGIGGCYGYLAGAIEVTHPGPLTYSFGAVFVVGLVVFLVGVVAAFINLVT